MMDQLDTVPDDANLRMARATLVALHSSIAEHYRPSQSPVVFLPGLRPFDVAGAVEYLARLPKPVVCIGLEAAGALVIGCWEAGCIETGTDSSTDREFARQACDGIFRNAALRGAPARAEVKGVTESVQLEGPEIERWLRDFAMPLAVRSVRWGDREGRLTGVDAVFLTNAWRPGNFSGRSW